ncbi:MAG TPA: serine hydrolase [Pyrinomonadaceae bacterium]|nr:serine hydrolase [Pyrinomonadaceae bacterium]
MKLKSLLLSLLLLGFGCPQLMAQRAGGQQPQVKQVKRRVLKAEVGLDLSKRLVISVSIPIFLSKNTDGKTGFYLKRVGGPVLIANDEAFAFYPASTIKVMEHLHAMRRVQSNIVSLQDSIDIWGDSCSDDHSDENPAEQDSLSDALRLMMKNSDNQRTNAIQDKFGRTAINTTAHNVAGMSQASALNHKFGCNGPNSNPPNRLTLADVGKLYEGVAQGTFLSGATRDTFYQLMRNETDSFFIESIINSEASSLALPAAKRNHFKSLVRIALKSGGIPNTYDGFLYQSTAGYVSLPFAGVCSESGFAKVSPREFVYGVFIDKANNINDGTIGTAASELFRTEIRSALKTWKDCRMIMNPTLSN